MAAVKVDLNVSSDPDLTPINKPGFVQNCPTPNVMEPAYCLAIVSAFNSSAWGNNKTGLVLPISENTGIGLGLTAA